MDVPGDGNCGYHAVMALLREKGAIDSNLSIMMIRRDIYMFIKENTEDVIQTLDYCVTFRDRVDRDILKTVMERIYVNGTNFDSHVAFKHWMDPGIEILIVAICYKTEIGYYDELRGKSCIVTPTEYGGGSVKFRYEILPPPNLQCMIVYNGVNHFGYLSCNSRNKSLFRGRSIDDDEFLETDKILSPLDEDYYPLYEPDYTSCEAFIRAIGYDIDKSSLIEHRVFLSESLIKKKGTAWKKEQTKMY